MLAYINKRQSFQIIRTILLYSALVRPHLKYLFYETHFKDNINKLCTEGGRGTNLLGTLEVPTAIPLT